MSITPLRSGARLLSIALPRSSARARRRGRPMPESEAAPAADKPEMRVPTVVPVPPLLQSVSASVTRPLAPMGLQARADRWMVRAVPELRYRLTRVGYTGVAGALSLAGA